MNTRTRIFDRNRRTARLQLTQAKSPYQMAEAFLAIDRVLVEVSMDVYNLKGHDRRKMRAHHGRLHAALREHLSELRKRSRD